MFVLCPCRRACACAHSEFGHWQTHLGGHERDVLARGDAAVAVGCGAVVARFGDRPFVRGGGGGMRSVSCHTVYGANRFWLDVLLPRSLLPHVPTNGAERSASGAWTEGCLLPRTLDIHAVRRCMCLELGVSGQLLIYVTLTRPLISGRSVCRGTPWDNQHAFVIEHRHLITARWPGDAYVFARRFIAMLEEVPRLY